MPNFTITANIDYPQGFDAPAFARGGDDMVALRSLIDTLNGVASNGVGSQSVYISWNDAVAVGNDATAGVAAALLVGSGLATAVGGTIGGTLVTATAAGGDPATQTLVAAAIRANTTVNQFVTANNLLMQMTLASVVAGTTVQVGGITFTAVTNAAAIRRFGDFNIDGIDSADATALALAINRHPSLSGRFRAVSNGAAVFIAPLDFRATNRNIDRITNPSASTITVNAGVPTASASCMVMSLRPGIEQNFITLTASGTGMTAVTNGTVGQLGGATGGGRVTQRLVGAP